MGETACGSGRRETMERKCETNGETSRPAHYEASSEKGVDKVREVEHGDARTAGEEAGVRVKSTRDSVREPCAGRGGGNRLGASNFLTSSHKKVRGFAGAVGWGVD